MNTEHQIPQQTLARALGALKEARHKLEAVERSRREPLAIVGMACRFPGSPSVGDYWSLIDQGRDGVAEVPRDRWPLEWFFDDDVQAPGRMRFREAGFLSDVDAFDARFFEISPREAERMDPQQRLLLQVAWEALDDAGIDTAGLAGTSAGVWVGVNSHDYLHLQLRDPEFIDTYTLTGGTSSIVANRISYLLDLRGPSLTVDTACSTSLVAVHLAAQSLRAGECSCALVGAVNLIVSPFSTMAHARGMPMASDGRCKTFDARADGYVRGEGCGVLVLKRLSDAIRNGDEIWAVIRGSAVNQDGRTNGLTAPNGLSQQDVIRRALEVGPVEPSSVCYLEAHGTGTELGDPIEVEALQQVYGLGRTQPCALGSVKANIGHLESAAGMAGLMKVALTLHHGRIPAVRGFERINPHIDLEPKSLFVPTTPQPWDDELRRGAVSSFGAGGTNAHVVLESAPRRDAPRGEDPVVEAGAPALVLVSSRDEPGLRRNAAAWLEWLERQDEPASVADLAYTTLRRRTRHEHRLAVWARSTPELKDRLRRWLAAGTDEDARRGVAPTGRARRIVFVCPGQGAQWIGMARTLLEHAPAFRESIEACAAAMAEHVDWSLMDRLRDDCTPFERIDVTQPTLWAVMVSLAAQWAAWGVHPDAVIGHSMGESAAAAISGVLSLNDAARVICRRSRLLRRAAGQGLMLLVGEPRDGVEARIEPMRDRVSIAVCNSPGSTVISGDPRAIEAVETALLADNVFHRRVAVDVASHSPQMDPLAADLRAELDGLSAGTPRIPMLSTVELEWLGGDAADADYWVRNLREPVRFAGATERLLADGHDVFVELSPHPILGAAIEQTADALPTKGSSALVLPSMLREHDELETMRRTFAALLTSGCDVEVDALVPAEGRLLRGPSYQWDQRRYWFCEDRWRPLVSAAEGAAVVDPIRARLRAASHKIEWIDRPEAMTREESGPWWIVGAGAEWGDALSAAFEVVGCTAKVLPTLPEASDPVWAEGPAGLLDLRAPGPGVAGVGPASRAAQTLLESLGRLLRVHAATPRIWVLTRGAQDEGGRAPAAAALWGLGRAAAIEYAGAWGGVLDLPADASASASASAVVEALRRDDAEDQLRIDDGGRVRVPRVILDDELSWAPEGLAGGEDRTLLVAGPAGSAAAAAIRTLHEREVSSLCWLDEGGATAVDPADREALALARRVLPTELKAVASELARAGRPVTSALRLPAPSRARALRELDGPALDEVMQAQAGAVERLMAVLDDAAPSLEQLVIVSTVAGSWGSMGMAHEGAAAAYLSAVARRRRAQGRGVVVVESTPWAGGGMVDEDAQQLGAGYGVEPLSLELAMSAVLRASGGSLSDRAVAVVDWARLRPLYEATRRRPLLGGLGRERGLEIEGDALIEKLRTQAPAARRESLHVYLGGIVSELLRHPADELDPDTGFFQLGMDSIMAMQLRRRLVATIGQPVPASTIFEHPTIARLTEYVLERLSLLEPPTSVPAAQADEGAELHELLAEASRLSDAELLESLEQELR